MQSSNSIHDQPHERGDLLLDKNSIAKLGMASNAEHAKKMTDHSAMNSTEVLETSVSKTNDLTNRQSVDLSKKAVTTGKKQQKTSDMLKAKKTPGSIQKEPKPVKKERQRKNVSDSQKKNQTKMPVTASLKTMFAR